MNESAKQTLPLLKNVGTSNKKSEKKIILMPSEGPSFIQVPSYQKKTDTIKTSFLKMY